MMDYSNFFTYLPPELRLLPWRAHPIDGKLLLFERDTGLNVLPDIVLMNLNIRLVDSLAAIC